MNENFKPDNLITFEELFSIMDKAKTNAVLQSTHLYWHTKLGEREVTEDEKRFIAIIEALDEVKQLGLDIDYFSRGKKFI